MSERRTIVHAMDGPWYGPQENAFNTLNKDLGQFSHVFADFSEEALSGEYSEEWCLATSEVQERADLHFVCTGSPSSFGDDLFRCIWYSRPPRSVPWEVASRSVRWSFSKDPEPCGMERITAVPWLEQGIPEAYPLVDHSRLVGMAGRVTKRTVGVVWDPHSEGSLEDAVEPLRSRIGEGGRVITLPAPEGYVDPGGAEVARRRWRIGFDWMYCTLCDSVVAPAGCRYYPFLLVSCMAMGKPCVAYRDGEALPPFVRDRISCLVASSPEEAADMAAWLSDPRNSDKARRLGAAAQSCVADHDRDANLVRLRRVLFA